MARKKKKKSKTTKQEPTSPPPMTEEDEGFGDLEDLFFSQDAGTFARTASEDPYAAPTPVEAIASVQASDGPSAAEDLLDSAPIDDLPVEPPGDETPPALPDDVPAPAAVDADQESGEGAASGEESDQAPAEDVAAPAADAPDDVPSPPAADPLAEGPTVESEQPSVAEHVVSAAEPPAEPVAEEEPAAEPVAEEEPPAEPVAVEESQPQEEPPAAEEPPADEESPVPEDDEEGDGERAPAQLGAAAAEIQTPPPAADLETPLEDVSSGTWEEVLQHLQAEIGSSRKHAHKAILHVERSRIFSQKMGDWDRAEEACRSAVELEDGLLPALRELVKICAAREVWPETVEHLTKQANTVDDPAAKSAALLASAHIRMTQLGDDAGAEADLHKALEHTKGNYIALRFLREVYYRQEDWSKLVDILSKAAETAEDGQRNRVVFELGRLHDEVLRKPLDAAPHFEACVEHDPRYVPAVLALERIYSRAEEHASLVKLYRRCGEALGGADRQFWMTRAARLLDAQLGDVEGADAAYCDALAHGQEELAPAQEYREFLGRREQWGPLVERTRAELEGCADALYAAGLQLQIGEIARDRLDDMAMARKAFDSALQLDPDCAPAQEGIRLLLLKAGDWDSLLEHYARARDATSDPRSQVTFTIKRGELYELKLSQMEAAEGEYRHALELAPNYLPARERLARVLAKTGHFEDQAMVLEQTASLLDGAEARSVTLYTAGRLFAEKVGNPERAIRCLELSMEASPGSLLNLAALVEAQLDAGKFKAAADSLQQMASGTEDPETRVSLLYRAAQLAMGELDDARRAEGCLRAILDLSPAFLGATLDLREILMRTGNSGAVATIEEAEASAGDNARSSYWWLYSAARNFEGSGQLDRARECFHKLLVKEPDSLEGVFALQRLAQRQKDELAMADLYRERLEAMADGAQAEKLRIALLETLYRLEDADSFAEECGQLLRAAPLLELPLTSIGVLSEAIELWSEAQACYEAATEKAPIEARVTARFQCGLLAEEFREDIQTAVECFQLVLEDDPGYSMAMDGLERLYTQTGDREGLTRLYGVQATGSAGNPVGTFYALLAGDLHQELNRFDDAVKYYEQAFEDPVGRDRAFEALRRIHLRNRDGEALVKLTHDLSSLLGPNDARARQMDLADGLLQIGDEERATAVYQKLLDDHGRYTIPGFHLKVMYQEREDWNGVLGVLEALQDRAVSKTVRSQIDDQINVVLRDRFIDRVDAKGFFERLHEKEPTNPLALKGLGAIAFREEDYEAAYSHFDELKQHADDDPIKAIAVYHLGRIADVVEGKTEEAAKAYEEALELDSTLTGPLDALLGLHTRNENWQGLVGVLSRQASLARERDKIRIYAEIARVWEEKLENTEVAIKSWNRVMAQDARFLEAYDRLMALYAKTGDHDAQIRIGRSKVEQLPEDRRAQLLYDLGVVAENDISSEELALGLYEQSSNCPGSHRGSLASLRRLAARRGDWEQVIQLAGREAELVVEPGDRIELYLERAQVRLNKQIDREAACPDFRRVLELDPNNRLALRFFVEYHYDRQAWLEALPVFQAYSPFIEEMDVEEDEDIREEVTLFYFKLGRVLANSDDPSGALGAFNKALELTPTHVPSLREAAPRLMELDDWTNAAKHFRQVLRLLSGFGDRQALDDATLNLGRCELQLGKTEQAMKRFKKILEKSPNDVGALDGMAQVHWHNEDWNTLLSTYNAIIKYARSAEQVIDAYLMKGDILEEKLGYSDKAALHYEKVLMYDKTNSKAMRRLSEICVVKEDLDKARRWAEVAVRTAAEQEDGEGLAQGQLLQAICVAPDGNDMGDLLKAARADSDRVRKAVDEVKKSLRDGDTPEKLLKIYRRHFAQL